ncbi:436_t:CDS:2 [Gigaspora margarita]|uniref:436_t:CDS:1 n=1 Tax=Gigaspora margarita TaxID=4874 RepID=A0ABN7UR37_GIGMA|nr:436_t:CDS:2 [Gigaspora margarita]
MSLNTNSPTDMNSVTANSSPTEGVIEQYFVLKRVVGAVLAGVSLDIVPGMVMVLVYNQTNIYIGLVG